MAESAAKFNRLQRERRNRAAKEAEQAAAPAKKRKVEKELRTSGREGRQAEREHRRSDKESRLLTREQENERKRARQKVIKPISKAAGAVSPEKGTSSSTALGLGVAGVAALFITAGILHKKLGQVLEGEAGESELEKHVSELQREVETPGAYAVSAEENKPKTPGTKAEEEKPPTGLPPNPYTVGSGIAKLHKWEALAKTLRPAVKLLEQVEKEWKEHKLSEKEAQKKFNLAYPKYATQSNELVKLHNELVKEHLLAK